MERHNFPKLIILLVLILVSLFFAYSGFADSGDFWYGLYNVNHATGAWRDSTWRVMSEKYRMNYALTTISEDNVENHVLDSAKKYGIDIMQWGVREPEYADFPESSLVFSVYSNAAHLAFQAEGDTILYMWNSYYLPACGRWVGVFVHQNDSGSGSRVCDESTSPCCSAWVFDPAVDSTFDSLYIEFHGFGRGIVGKTFYFPFNIRRESGDFAGDLLRIALRNDTLGGCGEAFNTLAEMTLTDEDISDSSYVPVTLNFQPRHEDDEWNMYLFVEWLGKAKIWVDWFGIQDAWGNDLVNGRVDDKIKNYLDRYSFDGDTGIVGFYLAEELWEDVNVYPQKRVDSLIKEVNADLVSFTEHHCLRWWEDRLQYGGRDAISARLQPGSPISSLYYVYSGYHQEIIDPVKKAMYNLTASIDTILAVSDDYPCYGSTDTSVCLQNMLDDVEEGFMFYKDFADSVSDSVFYPFMPFLQAFSYQSRLIPDSCHEDLDPPWEVGKREQSREEASVLASMALACGANGLLYYVTGSHPDAVEDTVFLQCRDSSVQLLLDYKWKKERKGFAQLPGIQDACEYYIGPLVDSLGYLFYRFDWQGAGLGDGNLVASINGSFISTITSDVYEDPLIEVGFFVDSVDQNQDYFFLVNRRAYNDTQTINVSMDGGSYILVDANSLDTAFVGNLPCDDSTYLSTELAPGQGKLFKAIPNQEFVDSLTVLTTGGAIDSTLSCRCRSGGLLRILNDSSFAQECRIWMNEQDLLLHSSMEMCYVIDQTDYDTVLTGPMPGSSDIPVTLEIPAQATRDYVVVPIDSSSGLPDSLIPYKLQGCVRIAGKTVQSSKTLNVYSPAVVKLAADARIEIDGTLSAEGTAEYPIQFVSAASSPAAGDWDWIKIVGGGEATLEYCEFKHAYKAVWAYAHTTDSSDYQDSSLAVSIEHCTFDSMQVAGIEFLTVPTSNLTVEYSTIDRCGSYGIRVRAGKPTIAHNQFGPPGNYSWYCCAVGGTAAWIADGYVEYNTFNVSGGWALYLSDIDRQLEGT